MVVLHTVDECDFRRNVKAVINNYDNDILPLPLQGFNELEMLLKRYGICIAKTEKLLKDSGVPSEDFYDRIVASLKQTSYAKGIT